MSILQDAAHELERVEKSLHQAVVGTASQAEIKRWQTAYFQASRVRDEALRRAFANFSDNEPGLD